MFNVNLYLIFAAGECLPIYPFIRDQNLKHCKMVRIILISLISLNIFIPAYPIYPGNSIQTESCIFNNTDTVWAGGYKYPQTSAATLGGNNEFFFYHQKNRIRQNGYITRVQMYCFGENCSEISIKFWRKNADYTFYYIGSTGNVINQLASGRITTFNLLIPVQVQEGEYYSVRINSTVLNLSGTADGDGKCYFQSGDAGTGKTAWFSKTPLSTYDVNIRFFMQAPDFVIIGNSIASGWNVSRSFCEIDSTTSPDSTIGFNLAAILNCTYQNMGIGAQTTSDIQARFQADVTNQRPSFAVIEGGVNDVYYGVSTSVIFKNYNLMLDSCRANNITAFVIGILPWTNGTNLQMGKIDSINAHLRAICILKGTQFIDCSAELGQERFTGSPPPPPGNHSDIKLLYKSADGVHYNGAGHVKIAQITAAVIKTVGINRIFTETPKKFQVQQNYPNPFNPYTIINFSIPAEDEVEFKIFNSLGQIVKTYFDEKLDRGNYSIFFDGTMYPSGVYFYKMQTENYFESKKMILIK